jgi:hypothetical protein
MEVNPCGSCVGVGRQVCGEQDLKTDPTRAALRVRAPRTTQEGITWL